MAGGLLALLVVWRVVGKPAEPWRAIRIGVTGDDYRLVFRYPGPDRQLGTADDRRGVQDLLVPAGAEVRLDLESRDYVYRIEIPAVNLYELAAPGLLFEASFVAPDVGVHRLAASQMCGFDHPGLMGQLRIQSTSEFDRAIASLPTFAGEGSQ
jgi:heme/copper-type cytochrome/quinol oxidase subunit 2